MGSNLSQHGKLSFQGIVRESAFSLPIQKDDQTVQSYFTQSKGEEVMELDNDAQGRADDIYWLQVRVLMIFFLSENFYFSRYALRSSNDDDFFFSGKIGTGNALFSTRWIDMVL